MNFAQIIQSLEQLIYEVAVWAIFAPKTLLKVITSPTWVWKYISSEITKDPSEQFDEYQSPILFWLIVGVLPFILVYRDAFASFGLGAFEVMAGVTVLLILIPQIIFTLVLQRSCKKPFTRTSLKPAFYAQCLCFAPLLLSYSLIGILSRTITSFDYSLYFGFIVANFLYDHRNISI